MAIKKPAVSTQLKNLKAEFDALQKEHDALKKNMGYEKTYKKNAEDRAKKLEEEVGAFHALLDSFECALPRESETASEDYPYCKTQYGAMTRLASWLAHTAVNRK